MRRIAILGLLGCTFMVLSHWIMDIAEGCVADLVPGLGAQAAAIDESCARRASFLPRLHEILDDLAHGRQSLRQASAAVEEAAAALHPKYLEFVATVPRGSTPRTQLAAQLLLHLETSRDGDPLRINAKRRLELQSELREMAAVEGAGSIP
ncbi:MAG: hypothetical protein L0Y71_08930 [Gemmataceae bacterium]|nr:hypothetical protein [Gemmataceae bacterium]